MSDKASGNWYPYNWMAHKTTAEIKHKYGTGTKKIEAKKQEPNVTVNQQRLGPLTIEELRSKTESCRVVPFPI